MWVSFPSPWWKVQCALTLWVLLSLCPLEISLPHSSRNGTARRSWFSLPTEWARGSGLGCWAWEVLFLVKPACQSPAEFLKRFLWSHVFKNYWFHMTFNRFWWWWYCQVSQALHPGSVSRIFQVADLKGLHRALLPSLTFSAISWG